MWKPLYWLLFLDKRCSLAYWIVGFRGVICSWHASFAHSVSVWSNHHQFRYQLLHWEEWHPYVCKMRILSFKVCNTARFLIDYDLLTPVNCNLKVTIPVHLFKFVPSPTIFLSHIFSLSFLLLKFCDNFALYTSELTLSSSG